MKQIYGREFIWLLGNYGPALNFIMGLFMGKSDFSVKDSLML
jgi:hypothetical protein